ncbi:integrin alpha-PS4-like [Pseudomyrmex gracilis]|uniref:integrin alpha-PS4-like n=1 Tax=Pseudomyrmex gracilis TaxID=219809 RepID=UPI00099599FA|nr:integrin alpha-PS4-like [Pseudomyrmex gracilis]
MSRARSNFTVFFYVRVLSFVLTIVQRNPLAYNINFLNAEVFRDPSRASSDERRSYFGFSVALYANAMESLVLVGAPRANSSALPQVTEPGTVFKCAPNTNTCEEWVVDKTGNGIQFYNKFSVNQLKNNAWIGATIVAGKDENATRVVVCGPRWINKKHYWFMNGICYATLATNSNAFKREAVQRLLPLVTANQIARAKYSNIFSYGMGQAGFSLHMNSLSGRDHVALGSPGAYNWKGDAIQYTAVSARDNFRNGTILSVPETQRMFGYFGYAITAGDYFYEQDNWYASSAPRNADMFGTVLIFRYTNNIMTVKKTIFGKQFGEYFGAALTSCDVNNDGRDELIVGASQWSKNNGMDEGRVYVFTVSHKNDFEEMQTIEGEIVGGRFGSTVVCLGDIDYDGYGDIAVGAPYEEENGGAVYVFNGNIDGVSRKYSQRLVGSEFSPTMRGFGIAISEPRDINRDNYLDIAVGAFMSDETVLLKSVPVVTVNVTLAYLQKINLMKNGTNFRINISMSYDGLYVPDTLQITAILKIDQQYGRAVYRDQKTDGLHTYKMSHRLLKHTKHWSPLVIDLGENIQNVIDPLEISVSVQLQDDLQASNKSSPCVSCVAINKSRSKLEDVIRLLFAVDCGQDDVCMSNLNVALSTDSPSGNIIGAESVITLQIHARNRGEPAYQTRVHVFIEKLSLASIPGDCEEGFRTNNILQVICTIENPFRTSKNFTLQLDLRTAKHEVKEVEIWANISTQSIDMNWNNNSDFITLYFDVDVDMAIVGKVQQNLYRYSSENAMSNIKFQHYYEVQKFGISPIDQALLTVKIPTQFRRSDTEHATIVSIDDATGRLNGNEFFCNISNVAKISPEASGKFNKTAYTDDAIVDQFGITNTNVNAKFSIEENATMSIPFENRTLYVNCTNEAVSCVELRCVLGPFESSSSVAKLTLDLQLSNFSADIMKDKDIIFYVTEGAIRIHPGNIVQRKYQKPYFATVATTFLGSPISKRIALWIVAVSIFLGIVLLLLFILGLIKLGFFNRKKKQELEILKTETDLCSSSRNLKQCEMEMETSFLSEVAPN